MTSLLNAFTPSQRALFYSCRSPDEVDEAQLRNLLRDVEWSGFFTLAFEQGVAPLVYRNLQSISELVPEDVLSEFQTFYLGNSLRNRHLSRELLHILKSFEDDALPALTFKGPILSTWAYGDLALRQFGDLDILVSKQDAYRAREVMLSLGFRQDNKASPGRDKGYHFAFEHEKTGLIVEVHWSLTAERFALAPDPAAWWQRRVCTDLLDKPVQTFCAEDTLLHVSIHGLKHAWQGLSHVCDVAAVLETLKPDLEVARERAHKLQCQRALELALVMASDLTTSPLPDETLPASLRRLRRQVYASLFLQKRSSFDTYRFWLAARERPVDKLQLSYQFVRTLGYDVLRGNRNPRLED